jgi:hypothetical protein
MSKYLFESINITYLKRLNTKKSNVRKEEDKVMIESVYSSFCYAHIKLETKILVCQTLLKYGKELLSYIK